MLIPQYTLRWLLAVITVCCVVVFPVFAVATHELLTGFRESCWASAVSITVVSLAVVLFVHALLFTLVWVFSLIISLCYRRPDGFGRSPFVPEPTSPRPKDPEAGASDEEIPATPILQE